MPSQTDFGKERVAGSDALRAQTSFEGALSANRFSENQVGCAPLIPISRTPYPCVARHPFVGRNESQARAAARDLFVSSTNPDPRSIEVSASAFRTPPWRMQRFAGEREAAVGADRRSDSKPFAIGLDAALDVSQIVLEGADLDDEFVAESVKDPFVEPQKVDDFLTTGTGRAHGSVVAAGTGGVSGPPAASHSLTGRPST